MLHADILVATTPNLGVYQWKRSRNVKWYVHLPHLIDDLTSYRMFALDHYDAVFINGSHQAERIRYFERVRNLPAKELPLVGSPYMDSLLEKFNERREEKNFSKKNVLVAPSWGKSAILSKFGARLISELVNTDFEIVIRPHPQSLISEAKMIESLMAEFSSCSNLRWNFDNDNFQALNDSDIMITDFSGIIFDYSLVFEKPLIYADTEFDSLPYDADWLEEGDEPWCFKVLPQIGVKLEEKDFSKIGETLENALVNDKMMENRKRIREEFWVNRGKSAQAIADYLIKKLEELN